LWAQGIGNFVCGIFGALPMTGVIVRSSVNVAAGAKTRMSTIVHGIWLLAFVLILPDVLRKIPTSALAAILVHTGYKLMDPANVRKLAQYGRFPVVIYAVTVIGIVATDLLTGVLAGVALTVARLVYQVSHLRIRTEKFDGNRVEMYLDGAATFIGLPKLAEALESMPAATKLHVHVERLTHIDHACMDLLQNWAEQGATNGSTLKVEWDELIRRHDRTMSSSLKESPDPEPVAASRD
jgi:MFS superfamily sulfate permease-like transporter